VHDESNSFHCDSPNPSGGLQFKQRKKGFGFAQSIQVHGGADLSVARARVHARACERRHAVRQQDHRQGTSSAEVSSFCGPPTQVDRTEAYRSGAVTADSDSQPTGMGADAQIEFWTYNFGPNLLMERVRIEDGIVVAVQSLGYGFNEE
jgi:hypothetical protein